MDFKDYINESVGNPQKQDYNFSIKSNTACQFKWTWSTLFLSRGTSSSCHRCKGWDVTEYMQDFHNHPGKLHDRQKMLEGIWPGNGCEYCKKIEESGGISERLDYVNRDNLEPPELAYSPNEIRVTPRILEVYFTNVCNQACAYCSPFFSSRIQQEIEKFGPLENEYDLMGFKTTVDYEKLKKDFWIWMENNSKELYNFQILGGEPMYQPEFEECLTYFEEREHPNLMWKIFSNLKHDPKKFKEKINRVSKLIDTKKINEFRIVCSQDSWGEQAEYARYGMDLKNWEDNFNTLLETPNVQISIHSTISPITLPTMAEFYQKIMEWSKIREINFGWNTVANPTFMNPEILGKHAEPFFNDVVDVLKSNGHSIEYFNGFRNQVITHEVDPKRLVRLHDYLNKIDIRRNTNWKELYPWLYDLYLEYKDKITVDSDDVVESFIKNNLEDQVEVVLKEYRNISNVTRES